MADELAADGVDVEVVDLRTVAPFDERTVLQSVAKTKRAVIVHESPSGVASGLRSAGRTCGGPGGGHSAVTCTFTRRGYEYKFCHGR